MSSDLSLGISSNLESPPSVSLRYCVNARSLEGGTDARVSARRSDCSAFVDEAPRIVTTGGNFSLLETPHNFSGALAHIDWFAFTIKPPEGCDLSWLFDCLRVLFLIPKMTSTGKGWFGYAERFDLGGYGLLAYGGESQRGSVHVELNATGCARVTDWRKVTEWGEAHNVTITRVDVAHDDIEGKAVSIARALEWHRVGAFAANGRPPAASLIDDLGSGKGKTLYIGNRINGKLCRIYEKGKQLGDKGSPWVRVEVELKNRSRVIPWDTLVNPGRYLAGAYPCLAFLSVIQEKIRIITKSVTVSLARAVYHAKQMVGNLVNVLMQLHSGDSLSVVNELKRDGIPRRLQNYSDFLPQVFSGLNV